MQTPASQLRAIFEQIGKLEEQALELYKGLPAESLDCEDDIDLVGEIGWLRWSRVCETHLYNELCEIEDATMGEPQWKTEF
jgi:hypothetical protein